MAISASFPKLCLLDGGSTHDFAAIAGCLVRA